jgi:hypothetical protein
VRVRPVRRAAKEGLPMGNNSLWRIIFLAIAVIIAISIVNYIIRHLLGTIISVAVVVGVLWLILNALTRKKSY